MVTNAASYKCCIIQQNNVFSKGWEIHSDAVIREKMRVRPSWNTRHSEDVCVGLCV